jgi:hypothetical protein
VPTIGVEAEVESALFVAELLGLQEQYIQRGDEYAVAPGVAP